MGVLLVQWGPYYGGLMEFAIGVCIARVYNYGVEGFHCSNVSTVCCYCLPGRRKWVVPLSLFALFWFNLW